MDGLGHMLVFLRLLGWIAEQKINDEIMVHGLCNVLQAVCSDKTALDSAKHPASSWLAVSARMCIRSHHESCKVRFKTPAKKKCAWPCARGRIPEREKGEFRRSFLRELVPSPCIVFCAKDPADMNQKCLDLFGS